MNPNELVLRPNCLLTRRPLILVTSLRSIFFYKKPWGDLPNYLYQHGYQISLLHLPFNHLERRKVALNRQIERLQGAHIFCDRFTYSEFKNQFHHATESTVTVFSDEPIQLNSQVDTYCFTTSYHTKNILFKLHQLFLSYILKTPVKDLPTASESLHLSPDVINSKILDHCVQLAEDDFCAT